MAWCPSKRDSKLFSRFGRKKNRTGETDNKNEGRAIWGKLVSLFPFEELNISVEKKLTVPFSVQEVVSVLSLAFSSLSSHELVTLPLYRSHPSTPTVPNHADTLDSFQPPLATLISSERNCAERRQSLFPSSQREVVEPPISWRPTVISLRHHTWRVVMLLYFKCYLLSYRRRDGCGRQERRGHSFARQTVTGRIWVFAGGYKHKFVFLRFIFE